MNDLELKEILSNKNKISKYISGKTNLSNELLQKLFDTKFDKYEVFMKRVEQYVLHNLLGHYDNDMLEELINKTLKFHPNYNIINRQLKKQTN